MLAFVAVKKLAAWPGVWADVEARLRFLISKDYDGKGGTPG